MTGIQDLARRLARLEQGQLASSTPQLAYSSIQNGALRAHDDTLGETMQIGLQWDGTYAPTVTRGYVPPAPSGLSVTDATEGLVIAWDGSFLGGLAIAPMDFLRVDVHVGATDTFTPDHTNRVASFVSPQGGSLSVTLPYGTYYVKLVCWTLAGKVSDPSEPVEGDSWPVEVSSDGFAPASSPAAEVKGGLEILSVGWTPIVNADPVTYEVHVSTVSGFTPDSTTLAGTVNGGDRFIIKALPGLAPVNPGDPDPRDIQYDTVYYVRIVARDADGAAAPGIEGSATIFQITGDNVAADTIRGNHIIAGEITGDKFSSTMNVSSAFWTALAGQRAGFTPDGFFAFRPDDSPIFRVPTDGSNAFFDGEFLIRGATITGGLSVQSSQNEFTADSVVTLMRGIVAPSATPQFTDDYEKLLPSTASLSAAQKTGTAKMGTFDLAASEVSQIEYKGSYWVIHQVRPTGTRSWFFDLSGNPVQVSGLWFNDHDDWQIWSTTEVTGSAVPARNGVYTMFRFIPASTWHIHHPGGISKYSLRNASQTPVLGHNADDVFVSEVLTNGSLQVHFVRPIGNADVPAPFSIRSTPASTYSAGTQLTAVQWQASYGTGGARYMVSQRGGGLTHLLVNGSAGGSQVLYPGGSSDNWASADKDSESFECPTTQRRGMAYDGTYFWTYGADGYLYKHTNTYWNPNLVSSKIWGRATLYDSDAGGTGTHETTPGPAISFTWKRRSRFKVTLPAPPDNGGADDPDKIRLYIGRGATSPANGNLWLHYTGLGPTTLDTLVVAGSNPPLINSFPSSNPAKIRSDDDSMYIKGDSSARFVDLRVGPAGATPRKVLREDAFWYGYMAAPTSAISHNTNTNITGFTPGDPNETGEETNYNISFSGGVFTVTDAGWYYIDVGLYWGINSAAGQRNVYIYRGASGGSQALWNSVAGSTTINPFSNIHRKLYLQAGGQFRVLCFQNAGVGVSVDLWGDNGAGTAGRYSYINIDRIRS